MDRRIAHAGIGRMRRLAGDLHFIVANTLVGRHNAPQRRLAYPNHRRLSAPPADLCDHRRDACTADFLIVRESEMHRRFQVDLRDRLGMRQGERNETLHVGRAASKPFAAILDKLPWIGGPGLPVDRHDVGMP
jgi:hypothetical protein